MVRQRLVFLRRNHQGDKLPPVWRNKVHSIILAETHTVPAIAEKNYMSDYAKTLSPRAAWIFYMRRQILFRRTDRLLTRVLAVECLAALAAAWWIGSGISALEALVVALLPIGIARVEPGRRESRFSFAVAQVLMAALLMHLAGGRFDAQFLVYGSLGLLAIYRDWRVLAVASLALPVAGISVVGWALVETAFLVPLCLRGVREMQENARERVALEAAHESMAELRRTQPALDSTTESLWQLAHAVEPDPALIEAPKR